jgi:hypothetical protein
MKTRFVFSFGKNEHGMNFQPAALASGEAGH